MAIYLKIDGIKGDVTASGHEDWINLHSLQWGVGRSIGMDVGGGSERETSKPSISEVTVAKEMDQSSPYLFLESCIGKGKKVEIHLVRTSGEKLETFMEYTLEDAMVSSYSVSSGGDRPSESLSFNFTKIETKYTPWGKGNTPGSPIPAGYDLATGKKV